MRIDRAPVIMKRACVIAIMVLGTGCASSTPPSGSPPPGAQAGGGNAPDVVAAETAQVNPEELIEPGDTLDVIVRRGAGEEKYAAAVRANGLVTVAFVDIDVKGLTEAEAEKRIDEQLASVIRNPRAQVRLVQKGVTRVRNFYVLGEVKSPGKYPLGRRTTLLQALGLGGGYTDVADIGKVIIISRQGETPQVRVANLQSVLVRGDISADLTVNNEDVVFVPRSGVGDFNHYYTKVVQPILSTVLGVVQSVFIGKALDVLFRTPTSTGVAVGTGGGCWVAGVLYGQYAWQTHVLRWYIWGPLSDHPAGRLFADLYRRYGRQAAHFLEHHPGVQALIRPLFDRLLRHALAALDHQGASRTGPGDVRMPRGAWPNTI